MNKALEIFIEFLITLGSGIGTILAAILILSMFGIVISTTFSLLKVTILCLIVGIITRKILNI